MLLVVFGGGRGGGGDGAVVGERARVPKVELLLAGERAQASTPHWPVGCSCSLRKADRRNGVPGELIG